MARVFPVLVLGLLSGCSALNPVTMARLATLDFMTVDPAAIVARIDAPDDLAIPDRAAAIEVTSDRSDTGQSLHEAVPLTHRGDTWYLAPADAARLRDLQAQVRLWEAEAPEANSGAITLGLAGCARGADIDRSGTVDADISVDGGQSWLPFLRDLSVEDILAQTEASGANLLCE